MTIVLRDYQTDMIDRARVALRRHRAVLIQSPTGSGKTALSAHMMGTASSKGIRSWFVCHRRELVEQTARTFDDVGIEYGFVAAGQPFNPHMPVLICAVDTLKNRLGKVPLPGLVVWDEAHHIAAAGWQKIRTGVDAHHVGLSATPERLDGKPLAGLFDALVPGPQVSWLIEQGYLSRYKAFAPSRPDVSGVRKVAGDYVKGQLEDIMDGRSIMGDAIRNYRKHADGKRAIAFCVSVKHAEHTAEQFRAAGILAVSLDGQTDPFERKRAIAAFRAGEIKVLVNVDLFGEGFDVPAAEAAIMLRPTASLGLHLQQCGRVLRPAPGKAHAVILDHAGNLAKHGLPDEDRVWTLDGVTKKKSTAGEETMRQCPTCYAAHAPAPRCPECGHVYAVEQERVVEQVDGDLAEVDHQMVKFQKLREQDECKTLGALIELGKRRGYRHAEKWAAHLWTARQAKERARQERRAG
jgi:DNA repair protein RadD